MVTVALDIERFTEGQGTNIVELLPKGAVVIGKRIAGEKFFTSSNALLTRKVRTALESLAPIPSDDSPNVCSDQEMLDVHGPKRIGESWSITTDCAARRMKETAMGMEPSRVQIVAKLDGVQDVTNTRCFRLITSGEIDSVDVPKPIRTNPRLQGAKIKADSTLKFQLMELLPLDESIPEMGREGTLDFELKMAINGGTVSGIGETKYHLEDSAQETILK